MSSQENISESNSDTFYDSSLEASENENHPDPSVLRAKMLAEDKRKRRQIYMAGGVLLSLVLVVIIALSFKPNFIKDSILVNNIELLSSNDGIDFYHDMEFYQWLDTTSEEYSNK